MKRFKLGQRVLVKQCGDYIIKDLKPPIPGNVVRLRRCDDCAWVELDRRANDEEVHPFPFDDHRSRHVMAGPDECDEVKA